MSIHADVTAPPYTDPCVRPSTTYYYEVESFNPIGVTFTSGRSNEVTANTSPNYQSRIPPTRGAASRSVPLPSTQVEGGNELNLPLTFEEPPGKRSE